MEINSGLKPRLIPVYLEDCDKWTLVDHVNMSCYAPFELPCPTCIAALGIEPPMNAEIPSLLFKIERFRAEVSSVSYTEKIHFAKCDKCSTAHWIRSNGTLSHLGYEELNHETN